MTYTIQNFTEAYAMTVRVMEQNGDIPPLVSMTHSTGPCYFQHSMTPTQAREMAQALWDCAHEVDGK